MATDSTSKPGTRVVYRERDGKPMAETTFHRDVMLELITELQDWFHDDPLAYVSGNEFLYFVEGDPKRNVSPDVWVARGIDKTKLRPSYKTWQEGGKGPDLVVEVSSKSTRREDLRRKFTLYRDDLRVREYFLFDPLGEYLDPQLQGFRLTGNNDYLAIEPENGRLTSEVLGLHLVASGRMVRLFDPTVGRIVPNRLEAITAAEQSNVIQTRTIREQAATLADRDRALERAELERAEFLAEIARLQSRERSD